MGAGCAEYATAGAAAITGADARKPGAGAAETAQTAATAMITTSLNMASKRIFFFSTQERYGPRTNYSTSDTGIRFSGTFLYHRIPLTREKNRFSIVSRVAAFVLGGQGLPDSAKFRPISRDLETASKDGQWWREGEEEGMVGVTVPMMDRLDNRIIFDYQSLSLSTILRLNQYILYVSTL